MVESEVKLRKQICKIGRLMRRYGYIDGTSGNISVRLDEDHVLTTPSGLAKGFMKPDQLIVVNMEGEKVGTPTKANRDLYPTSELSMHLECYKQRPDVGGVVHAHPPNAVALTVAGISLQQAIIPEVIVLMGLVPTAEYAHPSSTEDRDAIRSLIPQHDVLMLDHHGSLTVGPDVWTAYMRLETLEHYANILVKAIQLGGAHPLLPHQIEKLLELRQNLGLMRANDEAIFKTQFGVTFESER
ncbi:MAG: class II aldolase/adducin family protein [Chloroflexota bacterium]